MHEQRKTGRNRTYFGGKIAFNSRSSLMDCIVRNMSDDGAKLVFAETAAIPQEFDLSVRSAERSFRARVVWRTADEAGVVFVKPRSGNETISLDLMRRLRTCEQEKVALRQRIEQLRGSE